jgi:copper chaperone
MATTILTVPDISCEHCERTITGALGPVEGVKAVAVDIPAKQVRVDYDADTVRIEELTTILADEDYPVVAVQPAYGEPGKDKSDANR